jgi:Cu2+-exporting ATPase
MVAEKIGSETLLPKLCKWLMMPVARAPIQNQIELLSICSHSRWELLYYFLFGRSFVPESNALIYGFINAVAVLIIACPCAFRISYAYVNVGRVKERNLEC